MSPASYRTAPPRSTRLAGARSPDNARRAGGFARLSLAHGLGDAVVDGVGVALGVGAPLGVGVGETVGPEPEPDPAFAAANFCACSTRFSACASSDWYVARSPARRAASARWKCVSAWFNRSWICWSTFPVGPPLPPLGLPPETPFVASPRASGRLVPIDTVPPLPFTTTTRLSSGIAGDESLAVTYTGSTYRNELSIGITRKSPKDSVDPCWPTNVLNDENVGSLLIRAKTCGGPSMLVVLPSGKR